MGALASHTAPTPAHTMSGKYGLTVGVLRSLLEEASSGSGRAVRAGSPCDCGVALVCHVCALCVRANREGN